MSDAIPIFEAKNKLPFFVHKAESEGPVVLSRRNEDVAVILSMNDYNSLLKQAKDSRKNMTFLERVQDFKERNKDLYSDGEMDAFLDAIGNRNRDDTSYRDSEHIWDGIMEGADD